MKDRNMNQGSQKRKDYEKKKKATKIRSPLLDLGSNGGHNSCFHFLVSSNNSSSSASSSLSGSGQQKKPKLSSPCGKQRWKSTKENILPIPISLKSQKNASRLHQSQSGEKPASKTSMKSQIFPDLCSHGKDARSGSGKAAANLKRMEHKNVQVFDSNGNVSSSENFTPVGKMKTADCANFEGSNNISKDSDVKISTNVVKTPPIKTSVSPEIQCNVFSATSASAVTPCYSAGHVLSGVSDKRKCRPIGILTVEHLPDASLDYEIANKKSCIIGMLDEQKVDSLVPLPAEASMHWLLSSSGESGGDLQESGSADQIREPYSPSLCCKVDPDGASCSGSVGIVLPCQTIPCCKATQLHEERKCSCNFMKSPLSGSSASSDNVIQTPNSDSTSDRHTIFSCLNVDDSKHHNQEFESELDHGVAEVVNGAADGVSLVLQNDQILHQENYQSLTRGFHGGME